MHGPGAIRGLFLWTLAERAPPAHIHLVARRNPPMPPKVFALLIAAVIADAALTIWLVTAFGLPLAAVAQVALLAALLIRLKA